MSKSKRMAPSQLKTAAEELDSKGRYDVWSRKNSDAFRWKVLAEGLGCGTYRSIEGRSSDPFSVFSAMPEPVWSDFDSATFAIVQARALFSKDEDMRSPIKTEVVAFESFKTSEESCKVVNDSIASGELTIRDRDAACILHYAQRKIVHLLGDVPSIEDLKLSFGPGAAVTCRKKTTARYKLSTPPSISEPSATIVGKLVAHVPRWAAQFGRVQISRGSLEFVPKNYKTKRAIVIGTTLTGMAQRAVGTIMKQRLLQNGINLYDQTINRERARLGSRSGLEATIDLERASDSVAFKLVEELLPFDWYDLLCKLRDDSVLYEDQCIFLEKFSSMGCGFTFELESVIFYALGFGIAQHCGLPFDLTVYGDDMVCNTALARKILEYFPRFGFTPNAQKSYLEGPFRESCGGDFVHGVDVRPFFIRGRMTIHTVVCMYNHFSRKPHQDPDRKIRDLCLQYIPERFRNFGPDGYGDGHLVSSAPISTYGRRHRSEDGWEGWTFDSYVEVPKRDKTPVAGDQLLPFYLMSIRSEETLHLTSAPSLKYGLTSHYRDAFIRHFLNESLDPMDRFTIRKSKNERVKGKKVRIYVLGR